MRFNDNTQRSFYDKQKHQIRSQTLKILWLTLLLLLSNLFPM